MIFPIVGLHVRVTEGEFEGRTGIILDVDSSAPDAGTTIRPDDGGEEFYVMYADDIEDMPEAE